MITFIWSDRLIKLEINVSRGVLILQEPKSWSGSEFRGGSGDASRSGSCGSVVVGLS